MLLDSGGRCLDQGSAVEKLSQPVQQFGIQVFQLPEHLVRNGGKHDCRATDMCTRTQ